MSAPVYVERVGAIATVVLDRAERMNALDKAMWMRLGALMRELDADESLRCIVLRGAVGKAFAAGADISEFANERANAALWRARGGHHARARSRGMSRDPARGPHLGRARGLRQGAGESRRAGPRARRGRLRQRTPHRGRGAP